MKKSQTRKKQMGGGCGCGSGNPLLIGQSGGCISCSKMEGGGFSIPATFDSRQSEETYYPLNNYNHDPMMQTSSVRIGGVPVSNHLNVTGGNDIMSGGRKRKSKSKRKPKRKSKRKK